MSKKIALVLVMVILVNMTVWAEEGSSSPPMSDDDAIVVLVVFGALGLLALLIWAITGEIHAPDENIRLTSMMNNMNNPETPSNSFMNFMQHIQVGHSLERNKTFLGLRFQF
jgi:hypothetical protein